MSINDLLNDDFLPTALLIGGIITAIIILPMLISRFKKEEKIIYGEGSAEVVCKKSAKVLSKRSEQHPLFKGTCINIVLFELEGGERLELAIRDINAFSLMVEGDEGILSYSGRNFIDFKRG